MRLWALVAFFFFCGHAGAAVTVSEFALNKGSVLEFTEAQWTQAAQVALRDANGNLRALQTRQKFKVVSAPGYSKQDLRDVNTGANLHLPWRDLKNAKILKRKGGKVQVRLNQEISILEDTSPSFRQRVNDVWGKTQDLVRTGVQKIDDANRANGGGDTCNTCIDVPPARLPDGPPPELLQKTLNYLKAHSSLIQNERAVTIIDYSRPASEKRLWIVKLPSMQSEAHYVAHGKGSGNLYPTRFNGAGGSKTSVTGFLRTDSKACRRAGKTNAKEKGKPCLLLHGLESQNRSARGREIMFHGSDYVPEDNRKGTAGRSWGCPAVSRGTIDDLIRSTQGGSLVYIHQ